jgi:acetolactate synthase-1/3 small subunit
VGPNVYTIQLAGTSDKLDSFVAAMAGVEILEVVRSGVAGISRGEKVLSL